MVVAVRGECVRVGLRHHLPGGVFNEDTLDRAAPEGSGGGAVVLLHEIAKNTHEESCGANVEALVEGLACHARVVPVLEVARDLVQGRQSSGHGAEKRLEESGCGEFAGFADDQPGLACDQIKVEQARRPAGKAFDIPSLPARSPCRAFVVFFKLNSLNTSHLHANLTRMGRNPSQGGNASQILVMLPNVLSCR